MAPTVYSPPVSTYTALATYTVTGSAKSSVTFSSIPTSGYRDLILVSNIDATAFSEFRMRVNGDTGSNYPSVRMQASSGGTYASATFNFTYFRLSGNSDMGTDFSFVSVIQIMDYSATDKHKAVLVRANSSYGTDAHAGRWANTGAVTSLEIYPSTGNLDVGSTFSLYGIEA